jgi:hypothetical protein
MPSGPLATFSRCPRRVQFIPLIAGIACVSLGVIERPPISGVDYMGFIDAAGGSGTDSMTLAIAHRENDTTIIDATRERRPPFSPADVAIEFAALFKSYGITKITSDRWGGLWPVERFAEQGIDCEPCAKPKSDLYRDLLPAVNSRKIDLLDDARLIAQLCGLERRTARGGRDSIDHSPGSHDDVINSVAGVTAALASGSSYDGSLKWVMGDPITDPIIRTPYYPMRWIL